MSNTCFVPPSSRVAFVTGANGISGHAIIEHLIRTPQSEWSQIIVTSRKPPSNYWVDPRVKFVALDFLEPTETIVEKMKDVAKDVTHAFFTSYIHNTDFSKLAEHNVPLFRNFVEAVDTACPNLQRVSLQTGAKHYAFSAREFKTRFHEDTLRHKCADSEFYYGQEDELFRVQKRRNAWHYNIIRPFGVVGFTPQFSGINQAVPLALYFLICRELGQSPQWPGNLQGYHRVEEQSYAPSLADLTIWAVTQDTCRDEAFNHTNGDVIAWKFLWTTFAEYFDVPESDWAPSTDDSKPQIDLGEWAKDKKEVWDSLVAKYGGKSEAFQIDSFVTLNWLLTPSPQQGPFMSTISKARRLGWDRIDESYQAWHDTIRSYENAGVLPSQEALRRSPRT